MDIINRILLLLSKKGFKQIDLAEHLKDKGVTKQTITDWKKGKSSSYYPLIVDIAHFLGTSIDWLLTGEGDPTPAQKSQQSPHDSETMLFELLDTYRAADKEQRKAILQAALGTNNESKGETL